MKNKIILSCLLAVGLTGCTESFLDITPETSLSSVTFFKTQADFQQAVNACYVPLRTIYNDRSWLLSEQHSDNTYYARNTAFGATEQQEDLADFSIPVSNGLTTNTHVLNQYRQDYLIIARANQILALIDKADFDATEKANLKGQAQFMRGFAYFELYRYFNKAPLQLTPVTTREAAAAKMGTAADLEKIITDDLIGAAANLKPKSTQEAGRATSGAAKTVLANLYIIQKKWAEAEKLMKEVVAEGNYSLIPDYNNVFSTSTANKNNAESVFEVQFQEGSNGFNGTFMYNFLPRPMTETELKTLSGTSNPQPQTGEGNNIPTPDVIAAYEAGDLRKDASIGYITCATTLWEGKTYPIIKKYMKTHSLNGNHGMNWPVYRYSEVLLFLAEALNEQGKTAEAATYMNMVRKRAGLANTTATSQADFRTALIKERRVELAFENKRWHDLVRTDTYKAVITARGEAIKKDPFSYYYQRGYTLRSNSFSVIEKYYPMPADEAALNPNIK
ncbi:RagB/SusD family nutrient uptake outer membrane protein [Aquirufa ecclesiirivi]|uniref:RagB/SusD family nutrient uptake outer membrane protein n=1 Tax=Aquirufa ecclesiirivi TaxID=2715124 RepID=A0ABT4JC83_9BACT|nr:RagB/SusD family nutrient uptake outer membrane protein [Aquirufa ecclesiirivi]MCZ2473896.1 RagB/SusD family nutrient uptake outer membrane protein [Aquirufa ecclesiirivi]